MPDKVLTISDDNQINARALEAIAASPQLSDTIGEKVDPKLALKADTSAVAGAVTAGRLRRPLPPTRANLKRFFGASFAGHGWDGYPQPVSGDFISKGDDTSDFILGDRSFEIVRSGTATNIEFRKAGVSVDATGCDVRLMIKYNLFSAADKVSIFMYTGGATSSWFAATNVIDASAYNADTIYAQAGDHVTLDIPWSRFQPTNSPDRTNITRISVYVSNKAGQTATWNLDGFGFPYQDELNRWPSGVMTVTLDDCHIGQATMAIPYMDRFGYLATLFPIDNYFAAGVTFDEATLLRFRDAGHEIGAHASSIGVHGSGVTGMTEAQMIAEAEKLVEYRQNRQIASTSYAWPLGKWSPLARKVFGRYFEAGRLAEAGPGGYVETARAANPMTMRAYEIGVLGKATIKTAMDQAKAGRGHVNVLAHKIVSGTPGAGETSIADFMEVIDYAGTIGMPIRTLGEVRAAAIA